MKDPRQDILIDFTQMKSFWQDPAIYARGAGIWVTDVDGRRYIDGLSGIFVVNAGHGNQTIINAMIQQLHQLTFQTPLGATNPVALELVKLLGEVTPPGLKTVKLLNSGSEAIESALKMARQYHVLTGNPRKVKFISRYGSWHGATFGALSVSGVSENKQDFEPLLGGFIHMPPPYCYRCPYGLNYPKCDIACTRVLRRIIEYESPDTVAGVVLEPFMIRNLIVPPSEVLPMVRQICDEMGVLLIVDEVITGFGRLGRLFACELYDVVPDFLCLAKGMSGGYAPISAMVVHDKAAATFWGDPGDDNFFKHGHTFGGNPVSASAAIANIRWMLENKLPERAAQLGDFLRERLKDFFRYKIVGDIRGEGLLWGMEFVSDRASRQSFPASVAPGLQVQRAARARGLLIRAAPNWIAIGPPLVITDQELDQLLGILDASIFEVDQALV